MRFWIGVLLGAMIALSGTARAQKVTVVAGGGENTGNGPATKAKLNKPFGVAFDAAGNMFIVEYEGNRVCKVDKQGELTVYAGTGEKGVGKSVCPATQAQFDSPHHLVVDPVGDVDVADTFNSRVRRIDARDHTISTIIGTGSSERTKFGNIYCLAADIAWNHLYIDDLDNHRIWKVSMNTGIVTTVAGNGQRGVPVDGADAKTSPLMDPRAIAVDHLGNLYILERGAPALRVVDRDGKIRTVVGTGKPGPCEDRVEAIKATLCGPKHLCVDRDNTILIADTDNHVIRRYDPRTGLLTRVAGTGQPGSKIVADDPLQTELNQPHGVYVDTAGNLYISDSWNDRVLKITR